MAGKAIGEFSLKAITATYSPGPAGGVLNQVNWEGTATGFGAVFGTATFAGTGKGGTFSWCAEAFLDNGDVVTGMGPASSRAAGSIDGGPRGTSIFLTAGGFLRRGRSTWPRARGRGLCSN